MINLLVIIGRDSFQTKTKECYAYDKFKKIGNLEQCLDTDIMFFCLPTLFSEEKMEYDKSSIYETCEILKEKEYKGIIVLKQLLNHPSHLSYHSLH